MHSDVPSPSLAAVLIVRDEARDIEACLASLRNVVDAVYVHDTGSSDNTVEIARRMGAFVSHGSWTDDFSAARNEALQACDTDWVLSVDADERVVAGPGWREVLGRANVDVFEILMRIEQGDAPYDVRVARLFRRAGASWVGRVHEQLRGLGASLVVDRLDPLRLRMIHRGYQSDEQRRASSARNARLALAALANDNLESDAAANTYLDLGRSYVSTGDAQLAADAFETVRDKYPATSQWVEATDFLIRLVTAEQMPDVALGLIGQLSASGVSSTYCDWLAAQALVQQQRYVEAAGLLRSVDAVVDSAGRIHSSTALAELKSVVDQLVALHP